MDFFKEKKYLWKLARLNNTKVPRSKDRLWGREADVNIIGGVGNIPAGLDVDLTVRKAMDEGKAVVICHPCSIMHGLGIEKTFEMLHDRKVDGAEEFNSSESTRVNNLTSPLDSGSH